MREIREGSVLAPDALGRNAANSGLQSTLFGEHKPLALPSPYLQRLPFPPERRALLVTFGPLLAIAQPVSLIRCLEGVYKRNMLTGLSRIDHIRRWRQALYRYMDAELVDLLESSVASILGFDRLGQKNT